MAFSEEGRYSRLGRCGLCLRVSDTDLLYASRGGVEGEAADHNISKRYDSPGFWFSC